LRGFGPTDEAEYSRRDMGFVKYHYDIGNILREIENLNIKPRVTGIAWRKMIEGQIPEAVLLRISLPEYVADG